MENTYSSNGVVNKILVKGNSFNQKNSDAERKALGLKTLDEIKKRKAEFDAMNKNKKGETISGSVGKDAVVKTAFGYSPNPIPQIDYTKYISTPVGNSNQTIKPETEQVFGMSKAPVTTTTSVNSTRTPNTPSAERLAADAEKFKTSTGREAEIQKNLETITGSDKTLLSNQDAFKAKFGYADADQGKKDLLDAFYEKNKIAPTDTPPATSTDGTVSSYSKSQEENFKNLSDEERRMAQVKIDLENTATKKQQDIIRENLKESLDKNLITYDEYIKKIQDLQDESTIAKKQADVNLAKDIELKRIADSANLATLDGTVGVPESMRIAAVSDVGRKDEAEINAKMEATSKMKDLINTNLSKYALTEKELTEKKAEMETKYKEALNNPELAQILKEAKTLEEAEQAISDWKTSKDKKLFAEREAKDLVKIAAADYSNDWAQSTPDQRKLIAYSTAEQLGVSLPKGVIDAIVSQFPNDGPAVRNELQNKGKILESLPTWINQAIATDKLSIDDAITMFKSVSKVTNDDISTIGKSNTPGVVKAGNLGTDNNLDITDKYIKSATPPVTPPVTPTVTTPPTKAPIVTKLSNAEKAIMDKSKNDPVKKKQLIASISANKYYTETKKKAYLDYLNS